MLHLQFSSLQFEHCNGSSQAKTTNPRIPPMMKQSMMKNQLITMLLAMMAISLSADIAAAFTLPSSPYITSSCHRATATPDNNDGGDINSFESLGLTSDLTSVTQRMNWETPTAVQQLSIPAILDMYDSSSLWCEGPTGSGKTGGFALPLLQILMQQQNQQQQQDGKITTLILCPTRELAAQTGSVLQRLASYLPTKRSIQENVSIDVIHGGVSIEAQVTRLARKSKSKTNIDIVVATPGRLVDVLKRQNSDPTVSALERRIIDALDEKSSTETSLSLHEIQEMDLDRVDDDGRASLHEMLHGLEYLVLDEADRLLGNGFKAEMDELLSLFPPKKDGTTKLKTLLFSATFPEQIETRVDQVLSRMSAGVPLRVSTSAAMLQRVPVEGDDDDSDDNDDGNNEQLLLSNRQKKHIASTTPIQNVLPDTAPKIKHRVIRLDERDRTQALRFLLEQQQDGDDNDNQENGDNRVLVFVATRYLTEHVTRKLRRYNISAAELHGKLDQDARERRLKSFRSGKTRVLISTDLAARGIDVEGLPVVVNYDLPRSAADFTHRTGRTGRAGKEGLAISFVSAKSESHFDAIERKELQQEIEREVLPQFAPDEEAWKIESAASDMSVPGATHSQKGLAHDRMFGGVKSRRKSKKDKLREAAAKKAVQKKSNL